LLLFIQWQLALAHSFLLRAIIYLLLMFYVPASLDESNLATLLLFWDSGYLLLAASAIKLVPPLQVLIACTALGDFPVPLGFAEGARVFAHVFFSLFSKLNFTLILHLFYKCCLFILLVQLALTLLPVDDVRLIFHLIILRCSMSALVQLFAKLPVLLFIMTALSQLHAIFLVLSSQHFDPP